MNSLVGKSTGIALLLAAGLLAALFAMGVFSGGNVGAQEVVIPAVDDPRLSAAQYSYKVGSSQADQADVELMPTITATVDPGILEDEKSTPTDDVTTAVVVFTLNASASDAVSGLNAALAASPSTETFEDTTSNDQFTINVLTGVITLNGDASSDPAGTPLTAEVDNLTVTATRVLKDSGGAAGTGYRQAPQAGDRTTDTADVIVTPVADTPAFAADAYSKSLAAGQTGETTKVLVATVSADVTETPLAAEAADPTAVDGATRSATVLYSFMDADAFNELTSSALETETEDTDDGMFQIERMTGEVYFIGDTALSSTRELTVYAHRVLLDTNNPDQTPDVDDDIYYVPPTDAGKQSTQVTVSVVPGALGASYVIMDTVTAGAVVRMEIHTGATKAILGGKEIKVKMAKFGLPSTIDADSVLLISSGYSRVPKDVSVNTGSSTITINLDTQRAERSIEGSNPGVSAFTPYTIIFKQTADIKNPTKAGAASVVVTDEDPAETINMRQLPDGTRVDLAIQSKVSLKPSSGPRGTIVEVTGVGNDKGDATIYLRRFVRTLDPREDDFRTEPELDADGEPVLDDDENPVTTTISTAVYKSPGYRLDKGPTSAGKVVVSVDTTTQNFVPGTKVEIVGGKETLVGLNEIIIIDGAGKDVNVDARFEITPLVELDGDSFKRGGKVDVTISDWAYGFLDKIEIGGIEVTEVPRGSTTEPWSTKYPNGVTSVGIADEHEFSFIVPNSARLGEQVLKLTGTTSNRQGTVDPERVDVATSTILIGAFDLTIEPTTAVTGQVIKVEGSGYTRDACIVEITVGDEHIAESTSGNNVGVLEDDDGDPACASSDPVKADSNGNLADTYVMPKNLKAGTYRLTITDVTNRVGIAEVTVPDPEITLDPASSQRGSNVVVLGTNFPAEDVVTVAYRGRTVVASNTDTVGRFRATFAVPVDAPIGEEHEVFAKSEDKADGGDGEATLDAKNLHRVPDEVLDVSPALVAPGTRLTISARNLPLFTRVGVTIGGVGVAGSSIGELAESDGKGEWEGTSLVPQLTPGTHTVLMTVGKGSTGISVSTFVEIADIITRASSEAFEDLIDNGSLSRVWYLERETQEWFFYDPAPEFAPFNTLNEVSTGQIVDIIMTAQDEFQGKPLYVGSNPTSIE